jgi:hypothetical protein
MLVANLCMGGSAFFRNQLKMIDFTNSINYHPFLSIPINYQKTRYKFVALLVLVWLPNFHSKAHGLKTESPAST